MISIGSLNPAIAPLSPAAGERLPWALAGPQAVL